MRFRCVLRAFPIFLCLLLLLGVRPVLAAEEAEVRATLSQAILAEEEEQTTLIEGLAETGSDLVSEVLTNWRKGDVYIDTAADGTKTPFLRVDGKAVRVDNGQPIESAVTTPVETTSKLRRSMKTTLDLLALASPDAAIRATAANKIGMMQNPEYLPVLEARQEKETDPAARVKLAEGIAVTQLVNDDDEVRLEAIKTLGDMKSIPAQDLLKALADSEDESEEIKTAAASAVKNIDGYLKQVEFYGTLFRGLSTGSVLLVVALGLAITFGLMGVINMAHGEIMVVGAYTTYVVQCVFGPGLNLSMFGTGLQIPGMHLTGAAYNSYFLWALPASFLMAAAVGIALERGVIRFLYKRPLESLLATWGISLILQQLFRMIFGANNVQVSSPDYLSGSYVISDVVLGYNRLFVIAFAAAIVLLTWLLLTKTSLGLFIRAVMQNRQMASCMGVRTERVNMMTFGFGSGLAGLAGAFLSQLGNVGPGLGQNYIVDCFMTVVVGGVGNLVGTVASAMGIGMIDQTLQPLLGPVMGKITVLGAIILFLQWRPGGLFPTRSRSLEG